MSNFPVGSKIIITNADRGETYKNGDIFTVNGSSNGVGVEVDVCGEERYIASYEFEAYVEPFKVGDKVVVQANPGWAKEGQTGVIERVDLEDSGLPYDVKGDEEWNFWMREQDLELVADTLPREIAFIEIQKCDTIRTEYTQNGIKHTREGVAHEGFTGWSQAWATEEGDYIAHDSWKGATYTLLERPEPPKPNPFAEAKVGSIATYGEEGIKYLKTGENAWAPISRKGTLSDYRNSDESMTNCGDLVQVTHNA